MKASRANYDAVCVECAHHSQDRADRHMCDRARDLITGREIMTQCVNARSMYGYCGPEGKHFSAAQAVTGEADRNVHTLRETAARMKKAAGSR